MGLRNVNLIFSVLNAIAIIFKAFLPFNIIYLLIGMFINGIGNIHLVNSNMLFFKNWFKPKNA